MHILLSVIVKILIILISILISGLGAL